MRVTSSARRIKEIVEAIRAEELDLQPDFQRGEVWSKPKKQRLIDTVLRNWHIPPIHVVAEEEGGVEEVLDGQQRLAAIRDFSNGVLTVDGTIQPEDPEIKGLDGLTMKALPAKFKTRFNRFPLTVFQLEDFTPEEPAELFYRLNQGANLNPAEQRNAFIGPARSQIKALAKELSKLGVTQELLGYSNARLSHEDVLARTAVTVDAGTLRKKVTAVTLAGCYRSETGFKKVTETRLRHALRTFGRMSSHGGELQFNKATTQSWLLFLDQVERLGAGGLWADDGLSDFALEFQNLRQGVRSDLRGLHLKLGQTLRLVCLLYNDRSTSRVADTSSVLMRDILLWFFLWLHAPDAFRTKSFPRADVMKTLHEKLSDFGERISPLSSTEEEELSPESVVLEVVEQSRWGDLQ